MVKDSRPVLIYGEKYILKFKFFRQVSLKENIMVYSLHHLQSFSCFLKKFMDTTGS